MSFIHHQNSKNKHIFKDQLTIYDFDVIKELGNGHFAHVYMSKYKYTDWDVLCCEIYKTK